MEASMEACMEGKMEGKEKPGRMHIEASKLAMEASRWSCHPGQGSIRFTKRVAG